MGLGRESQKFLETWPVWKPGDGHASALVMSVMKTQSRPSCQSPAGGHGMRLRVPSRAHAALRAGQTCHVCSSHALCWGNRASLSSLRIPVSWSPWTAWPRLIPRDRPEWWENPAAHGPRILPPDRITWKCKHQVWGCLSQPREMTRRDSRTEGSMQGRMGCSV